MSGDRVFSWRQSQLRLKIKMNFSLCAAVNSPINKKSRAEISRFELQLFAFLCLESGKNLHYQQQFQMAGASPLLYVTVQRLASDCMSFSSYDPLLWPTTLRFDCLSSCWSLRLGFLSHYISICLHPEVELNYTSVRLCADNNAWTCSATAKVKVNERVDAEDEGTLKTEPTRPRQLDKLLTWLVAYYRTLSDITYPNQSYTVGIHYYSSSWRSA